MSFIYNLSDSWNDAATTWNGIKLAVTDSGSNSSSKLLNLTISGSSTGSFTVDKSGNLVLSGTVNKITMTTPATGATLTLADGSTFATSGAHAATFTFTGPTAITFPTSGSLTALGNSTTGSGNIVLATSPTLVTPVLGTPSSGVLSSCTGYPVSALTGTGTDVLTALAINVGSAGAFVTFNGALGTPSSGTLSNATGLPISTGVDGLGSGVATFLATPSSANLASVVTDETGSGSLVFGTSPTFTTQITAPLVNGGTTASSTLTLQSTSGSGTSDSIVFKTASQSTRVTINSAGLVGIGMSPAGTDYLDLAAGTTAIAPLGFSAGTNLTTANAGSVEYDGKVFYATSVASSRQVVDTEQFVTVGATPVTLSNSSTAAQNVFATANDTITLAAATTYFFDGFIYLSTGTTSHTTAFGFDGTSTFTSLLYEAITYSSAANTITTSVSMLEVTSAAATVLNAASTAATTKIKLKGVLRVNAGGTLVPQITFSAGPTGTCQTNTNSFMRFWPIGSNTVISVGNWS